jgi:hypothetical protein
MTRNFLYKHTIPINKKIGVYVPRVGEILQCEDEYYAMVSLFTAMPIDYMVQLDDAGIDFTAINEWQMFLLFFNGLKTRDASMILGDLDLSKFEIGISEDNGGVVLIDTERDIRIDRALHGQIANTLRKIHHLEKNRRKPANDDAKEYMLERARKKMKRRQNHVEDSQLESLIIAMVNTEQFKYDFEGTLELSIYQFNESVRQIIKKVDYDNRMHGIYAGTVNAKDLNPDDLNWLIHK